MNLKAFDEFLKSGVVKKQTPNKERALSLIKEAEEKRQFLTISLRNIPKSDMSPNFIIDYCYDIIMELLRAKMFIEGYNPGASHEAEVAYMKNVGFPESEIRFMNEVRYYRNGTKYYGTILDADYAEKVLWFMERAYGRLMEIINEP